jgi:hypothetical protein
MKLEECFMSSKDTGLGRKRDSGEPRKPRESEEPLENQPLEWSEEDRKIEDRKPDLGETEEDTSEL